MLSKEEIVKLGKLARIGLTEQEVEKFQKELSVVLDYVEELKSVNVDGLEEVSQVTGLVNVQREDKATETAILTEIFSQAPEIKDRYFIYTKLQNYDGIKIFIAIILIIF